MTFDGDPVGHTAGAPSEPGAGTVCNAERLDDERLTGPGEPLIAGDGDALAAGAAEPRAPVTDVPEHAGKSANVKAIATAAGLQRMAATFASFCNDCCKKKGLRLPVSKARLPGPFGQAV